MATSSAWRNSGRSCGPCARVRLGCRVVSASFGGQPQNGNGPPVMRRLISDPTPKRLLVLSGLSLTILSSWSQAARHGASPGRFSASAKPRGKPSGKSKPTSTRSPRLRWSSRMAASFFSASARVGGLKDSKARRKRTSRFRWPIQTESAPVAGLAAALQSTIT